MILKYNYETKMINISGNTPFQHNAMQGVIIGAPYTRSISSLQAQDLARTACYSPSNLYSVQGDFSGVVYNGKTDSVTLFNDLFGIRKLFYYQGDHEFLVSDSLDSLLKEIKEPLDVNYEFWAELVTMSHAIGNKTPVKQISTLRRTEVITFSGKSQEINSYFYDQLPNVQINETIEFEEAVERVAKLLDEALEHYIKRYPRNHYIVTVSGGWDSRLLAALFSKHGIPFETQTTNVDREHNQDEKFAKKAMDFLGVDFQLMDLAPDYFQTELIDAAKAVDFSSTLHPWMYHFTHSREWKEETVVFDGLAGDYLFRPGRILLSEQKDLNCFYQHSFIKSNVPEWFTTENQAKTINHRAKNNAFEEYKKYNSLDNGAVLFLMGNRSMRNITYAINLEQSKATVVPFFTYRPLFEYILSLPFSVRYDDEFYPALLDAVIPGLSEVPSTNYYNPETSDIVWDIKEPYKINPEMQKIFETHLLEHPEENNNFLDPIASRASLRKLKDKEVDVFQRLRIFTSGLPFLYYAIFLEEYKAKLSPTLYFEDLYFHEENKFNPVLLSLYSNKKQLFQRHKQQILESEDSERTMNILMTMNMDAHSPEDIYSLHTTQHDVVNQLILNEPVKRSLFGSRQTVFSYIKKEKLPFTFYVDTLSDIYETREGTEIVRFLNTPHTEIGLTSYPFSFSKEKFNAYEMSYNNFISEASYQAFLAEGSRRIETITGEKPLAYRSGSFLVYDGLLPALKKTGFKVDSSLYYQNPRNYSKYQLLQPNAPQWIDGILEIPVSTYQNLDAIHWPIRRFDFNELDLEGKLQFLVKSLNAGVEVCTMLSHSWSFLAYERDQLSGKLSHTSTSRKLLDEFKWMIEFIQEIPTLSLGLTKDVYHKTLENDSFTQAELVKLGNYKKQKAQLVNFREFQFEPYYCENISLTHHSKRLESKFQKTEGNAYIQLFGGVFTTPVPEETKSFVKLKEVAYITFEFNVKSTASGSLDFFFMEYNEEERVGKQVHRISLSKNQEESVSYVFRIRPHISTYKLAFKYNFSTDAKVDICQMKIVSYYR